MYVVSVSLTTVCLGVFLLGFILYGTLHFSHLINYFLFHVGEIFNYNLFKNFLIPFLFPFFFWNPYNSNIGAFDIVSEVSETIPSSFHSFYFILLFRSYFYHLIFQLTDSFFCFIYSVILPSRVFLISVIMLFVSVCLFFNQLTQICSLILTIFPFCFQGFWSSLLSLFWFLFQVTCLFPLHLLVLLYF